MSEHKYVDLSRLFETPKSAIFFQNTEEAALFYHNCTSQYGYYIRHWSLNDVVRRWMNNEGCGFTFMTGNEPDDMSWCDRDWFEESGYDIIEFADLFNSVEIEESEMPLAVLLSQDSASTPS